MCLMCHCTIYSYKCNDKKLCGTQNKKKKTVSHIEIRQWGHLTNNDLIISTSNTYI